MLPPPNVIFIITDDQGYGDIAYQGNPWLKTPQLDRLARESVQLDNHHHEPLCSPSRAALLTGQYAARNGVWHVIQGRHLLRPGVLTMADFFAAQGYRTGMFGKWHLGDNYAFAPEQRGFQKTVCHRGGGIGELPDYWGNNYIDDHYFYNGAPQPGTGYCTDVFFDAALDFIEANAAAPFFIYLAPNAMHSPFIVPEKYAAPYIAQGLPADRAHFYGMIANFDENLGRLCGRLETLGLDENTIVIFTADHGTAAGYDPASGAGYNAGMRGKKGSVYDGGHRVNFFWRWPGQLPAERVIRQLTAHIDILPTLIELCDLRPDPAPKFDGISLAPLLCGAQVELPARSIVVQLQPATPQKWQHSAVLKGNWRLVNGCELYNIASDPGQKRDIATDFPQVLADLRRAYDRWWQDMRAAHAQVVAIPIGSQPENPTLLSARDWQPTVGQVPWLQSWIEDPAYDANGFWWLDVVEAGRYQIALRSYPLEVGDRPIGLGPLEASLRIGAARLTQTIAADAAAAHFQLDLPAGRLRLQTWLRGTERERGAYYTYVRKL